MSVAPKKIWAFHVGPMIGYVVIVAMLYTIVAYGLTLSAKTHALEQMCPKFVAIMKGE